jgi:hypothetical protein
VTNDVVGAEDSIATAFLVRSLAKDNLLLIETLEAAKHALVTCHGLWATDQVVGPHFQLDHLKTIEKIEEALGN